ncbi:sporulation-specific L-Ala-D-Glu endopeptidase [[Clostridium] ultunense Esp]|nr:sporulation-specific L-Ala-D-Glu endopeptidase [[Clostridium] ultunense Esp]
MKGSVLQLGRLFRSFKTPAFLFLFTFFSLIPFPSKGTADEEGKALLEERMALFERMESITLIPWYYLAAIDQYERSTHKTKGEKDRLIAIRIPSSLWSGPLNPDQEDENPVSISFFQGIGEDGDGDGFASLESDEDLLYTFAHHLSQYGTTEEDLRIGLWEYYEKDKAVRIIHEFAQIFKKYNRLDLFDKAFVLDRRFHYSYHSTWGDPRGWGGRRIHEGTDLFAGYGTPVRSSSYGYVEIMGWNKYGGWRIGIRDLNNIYHYYAHLSGFQKGVKTHMIVEPGQVIGYVGSSGYGKPGTSGKFPPHLHYGMYKYNGRSEWAFDPYPHLKLWERNERKKR